MRTIPTTYGISRAQVTLNSSSKMTKQSSQEISDIFIRFSKCIRKLSLCEY